MPTENENKVENLIDVGEADQQETEINLDEKGNPEKIEEPKEEKIEVEEVSEVDKTYENERETKLEKKEDKDELKDYSEGVQKRIAKLTRKMREAERQKEEAIQFAQMTKAEKDRLDFLNERKEYYLSLQEDVLDKLWLESDGLIESEKEMLKRALRYKKGWTKVP